MEKGKYGAIGEFKVARGKIHSYLGMTLDYSVPGQVSIDMTDYVKNLIEGFPSECLGCHAVKSPWNENLLRYRKRVRGCPRTGVTYSILSRRNDRLTLSADEWQTAMVCVLEKHGILSYWGIEHPDHDSCKAQL
jgi:hypothetical protein